LVFMDLHTVTRKLSGVFVTFFRAPLHSTKVDLYFLHLDTTSKLNESLGWSWAL
jgi:hypothetical protein